VYMLLTPGVCSSVARSSLSRCLEEQAEQCLDYISQSRVLG